jgi:putative ABC transport system permease protein
MNSFDQWFLHVTADWRNPVGLALLTTVIFLALLYWEYTRFILKSVRRNLVRSILTGLATFALVLIVTMCWSVLAYLDKFTEAKSRDLKAIVSERYQMPSRMPFSYESRLAEGAPRKPGDYRVDATRDSMHWSFYVASTDPRKQTRESAIVFFAMDPSKLLSMDARGDFTSMMEGVEDVSDEVKRQLLAVCEEMAQYPFKVVIGPNRLAAMNKRVGERIKVSGTLRYKDIDLELEIAGVLPGDPYTQSGVMNYRYLDEALKKYEKDHHQKHHMADKSLAMEWIRVPDMATFEKVAEQISSSPEFQSPYVKCETAASSIGSYLDPWRDFLFGMRWLLVPAILGTMALVIANAISISVRERRMEMAVLKVLGFSPNQILVLVLSEALLVGAVSGLLSALALMYVVNDVINGITLPMGFFAKFFVASAAPWWGISIGAATALVGSVVPAWSARSVKVAEVFSKVA